MTKTVHGIVRGNTIQLTESLGVAEGQEVTVRVSVIPPKGEWGEGVKRSAGILANDTEWDSIMEEIYQNRKLDQTPTDIDDQ